MSETLSPMPVLSQEKKLNSLELQKSSLFNSEQIDYKEIATSLDEIFNVQFRSDNTRMASDVDSRQKNIERQQAIAAETDPDARAQMEAKSFWSGIGAAAATGFKSLVTGNWGKGYLDRLSSFKLGDISVKEFTTDKIGLDASGAYTEMVKTITSAPNANKPYTISDKATILKNLQSYAKNLDNKHKATKNMFRQLFGVVNVEALVNDESKFSSLCNALVEQQILPVMEVAALANTMHKKIALETLANIKQSVSRGFVATDVRDSGLAMLSSAAVKIGVPPLSFLLGVSVLGSSRKTVLDARNNPLRIKAIFDSKETHIRDELDVVTQLWNQYNTAQDTYQRGQAVAELKSKYPKYYNLLIEKTVNNQDAELLQIVSDWVNLSDTDKKLIVSEISLSNLLEDVNNRAKNDTKLIEDRKNKLKYLGYIVSRMTGQHVSDDQTAAGITDLTSAFKAIQAKLKEIEILKQQNPEGYNQAISQKINSLYQSAGEFTSDNLSKKVREQLNYKESTGWKGFASKNLGLANKEDLKLFALSVAGQMVSTELLGAGRSIIGGVSSGISEFANTGNANGIITQPQFALAQMYSDEYKKVTVGSATSRILERNLSPLPSDSVKYLGKAVLNADYSIFSGQLGIHEALRNLGLVQTGVVHEMNIRLDNANNARVMVGSLHNTELLNKAKAQGLNVYTIPNGKTDFVIVSDNADLTSVDFSQVLIKLTNSSDVLNTQSAKSKIESGQILFEDLNHKTITKQNGQSYEMSSIGGEQVYEGVSGDTDLILNPDGSKTLAMKTTTGAGVVRSQLLNADIVSGIQKVNPDNALQLAAALENNYRAKGEEAVTFDGVNDAQITNANENPENTSAIPKTAVQLRIEKQNAFLKSRAVEVNQARVDSDIQKAATANNEDRVVELMKRNTNPDGISDYNSGDDTIVEIKKPNVVPSVESKPDEKIKQIKHENQPVAVKQKLSFENTSKPQTNNTNPGAQNNPTTRFEEYGKPVLPKTPVTELNSTKNKLVIPNNITPHETNKVVLARETNPAVRSNKDGLVVPTTVNREPVIKPRTESVVVPTTTNYNVNSRLPDRLRQYGKLRTADLVSTSVETKPVSNVSNRLEIQNKIEVTSGADMARAITNGKLDNAIKMAGGLPKVSKILADQFSQQKEVPLILKKLANGENIDTQTLNTKKVNGFKLSEWRTMINANPALGESIKNSVVTLRPDVVQVSGSQKVTLDIPSMVIGALTGKVNIALESHTKQNIATVTSFDIQSSSRSQINVNNLNFKLNELPETGSAKIIAENGLPVIYEIENQGIKKATFQINRDGKPFAKVLITDPVVLSKLTSGEVQGQVALDEIVKSKNGVTVEYSSGSRSKIENSKDLLDVMNGRVDTDPQYLKNEAVSSLKFDSRSKTIPDIVVNGQNFYEVAGKNMGRLAQISGQNGEIKTDFRLVDPKIRNERALGLYLQTLQSGDSETQAKLLEGLTAFRQNQAEYGLHKLANNNNPKLKVLAGVSSALDKVLDQQPVEVRNKINRELRNGQLSDISINEIRNGILVTDNAISINEAVREQQRIEFENYRGQILRGPIPKEMRARFNNLTSQEQAYLVEQVRGKSVLSGLSPSYARPTVDNDNSLASLTGRGNVQVEAKKISGGEKVTLYAPGIDQQKANQQLADLYNIAEKNSTVTNRLFGIPTGSINGVTAAKVAFALQNIFLPVSISQGSSVREGSSGVVNLGGEIRTQIGSKPEGVIAYAITQDGQILQTINGLMQNGTKNSNGNGLSFNESVNLIAQNIINNSTSSVKEGKTTYTYKVGSSTFTTEKPISRTQLVEMTRSIAVNAKEIGRNVKTATGLTPTTGVEILVNKNIESYSSNEVIAKMTNELGVQARIESEKVVQNLFKTLNSINSIKISNQEYKAIQSSPNFKLINNAQELGLNPNNKIILAGKFYKDGADYSNTFGEGFYMNPKDTARFQNGELVPVYFAGCHGNRGFIQLPKVQISGNGETGYSVNTDRLNTNISGEQGGAYVEDTRQYLGIGGKIPKNRVHERPRQEQPKPNQPEQPQKPRVEIKEGTAQGQNTPASQPGADTPLPKPNTPPVQPKPVDINSGVATPQNTPGSTPGPDLNIPKTTIPGTIDTGVGTPITTPGSTPVYQTIPNTPVTPINNIPGSTIPSTIPGSTPAFTTIPTNIPPVTVPVTPPNLGIIDGGSAGEFIPNLE